MPAMHAPIAAFARRYAVQDERRVWPVQQYRLASGRDAFLKGLLSLHEDEEKRTKGWIERKLAPAYDPAHEVGGWVAQVCMPPVGYCCIV